MYREGPSERERSPLQLLLIGSREEDYFFIQDLLRANGDLVADLDHAPSFAEARTKLAARNYDLVLFEHESSESEALEFVQLLRSQDKTIPFLFLTEHTDDATLAEVVEMGGYEYVSRAELNHAYLVRAIRSALSLHELDRQRRIAEERFEPCIAQLSNRQTWC